MIIIALVIILYLSLLKEFKSYRVSFQIYYWKIDKSCKIYIFLALVKIKKIKIL